MKTHSIQSSRRESGGQAPTTWIDLDGGAEADREWLRQSSGLDGATSSLLLNAMPRTRCVYTDAGVLITLVRPDAGDDDGQDLDVWLEPGRVITVSHGDRAIVTETAGRVDCGAERGDGVSLLAALTTRLVRPLETAITELAEDVDDLEDASLEDDGEGRIDDVVRERRRALGIRRRLNAMHGVVSTLSLSPELYPQEPDLDSLERAADYLGHLVAQVDAIRDRLILLFDQISAREQHRINRAMQKLAVVGTVFLPLTFFTGLLGINVAGIPDAHDPKAFWLVCGFLLIVVVVALVVIRWRRWI